MIEQMPPFYRGDDYCLRITLRDQSTDTPYPIDGWHFVSSLKLSTEMPDSEGLQVTYEAPDNPPESMKGVVLIHYPKDQTNGLLTTTYLMDLQATMDDGIRQTLFVGSVAVLAEVTRDD